MNLVRPAAVAGILLAVAPAVLATETDLPAVRAVHEPAAVHTDQTELLQLIRGAGGRAAFRKAFERGDRLFDTAFNALDGAGANVGEGQRFTRVPRADLTGPGEWASHVPPRTTGPNAQSCSECHSSPFDDGAGPASADVHRDPLRTASLRSFIRRNTPHLFGAGAVQVLAEEMTRKLWETRDAAKNKACETGLPVSLALRAKGVYFGEITATCGGVDTSGVDGISPDLVVRPFQWKGINGFLRDFIRGAAHNELGMQAVEIVGDGVDGDHDGVADELTVGDLTVLSVYLAAQPRPTTKLELAALGLIAPLSPDEVQSILRGRELFGQAGCASCHMPEMKIHDPVFTEPSQHTAYRDIMFPAGQDPVARGLDPLFPVSLDLTRDQPDNRILDGSGHLLFRLGSLKKDSDGNGIVRIYGDLKRHDMGPGLAENIDEAGTGSSTFLTENLWGVGSTAPYMHDGRATTLTEAILEHGGEAAEAKGAFVAIPAAQQRDLVAFLQNLVLFKLKENE